MIRWYAGAPCAPRPGEGPLGSGALGHGLGLGLVLSLPFWLATALLLAW